MILKCKETVSSAAAVNIMGDWWDIVDIDLYVKYDSYVKLVKFIRINVEQM